MTVKEGLAKILHFRLSLRLSAFTICLYSCKKRREITRKNTSLNFYCIYDSVWSGSAKFGKNLVWSGSGPVRQKGDSVVP